MAPRRSVSQDRCRCGCGTALTELDRWGRPRAYVHGHATAARYAREQAVALAAKHLVDTVRVRVNWADLPAAERARLTIPVRLADVIALAAALER